MAVEGYIPRRNEDVAFLSNAVGPDYFSTMRIPLRAGRAFEERDDEAAARVAIVNTTLAKRFWGGASKAVGKRIRLAEGDWRTVIGVAADVKYLRLDEPPRPYVYLPLFQAYRADMILHTRGAAPDEVLVKEARAHVEALDANLPILYAKALAGRAEGALIFFKLAATMLSVFGAAGLALAAMGTYGLVSYVVRQSTHEIGIRIALGASGGAIVRTFLRRGLWLGVTGAVLGTLASLAATRLLGSVRVRDHAPTRSPSRGRSPSCLGHRHRCDGRARLARGADRPAGRVAAPVGQRRLRRAAARGSGSSAAFCSVAVAPTLRSATSPMRRPSDVPRTGATSDGVKR